ncbi:hypothetical protein BST55_24240 [Vibrio vulnificus]|uniref:hypothetical protein n=1 Tax=Vibrio vulnificus TaxID=672 RepID=UPI000BA0F7CD|nr:hypothetical protein [Vibrio vulnificus]MCA0785915.1 hypothetical protein [Vibrio vulnificus]MCU8567041.1 hypothetical protein [Vibrio vulnificus]OZS50807.1 hypothetical protein BST51_23955 [Vibrio vulnificus]OZS55673.1 hypothetical protein BST52_22285 [Vibrio vulnificus]OZS60027.1 hypothetical protein BST56_24220 [Vibrio vulnificus]
MKSSLRKIGTGFEFQYEFGCEDINGVLTSAELIDGSLVVSTDLKPISSNQRDDIAMLLSHIESVTDIVVREAQIRKNLLNYCRNHKGQFNNAQLKVKFSSSVIHTFNVEFRSVDSDGVGFSIVA